MTAPPENDIIIDWCSVTVKKDDPKEATALLRLEESLFIELPYGRYGYKRSLQYGNISVLFDGKVAGVRETA